MKISSSILMLEIICLTSCQTKRANEDEKIKALLKREQTAHLTENVDMLISEFAEGMVGVNRGVVTQSTKEEHQQRISQYFNNVDLLSGKTRPIR